MDDINTTPMGKKVFFLHPSVFVQNTVIEPLILMEFEVYLIKDETKILKLLKKYPDSLVFASINEALDPQQWEAWMRQVKNTPALKEVSIGVISNTNNDNVRKLYLDIFKVDCGFIPVKQDKDRVIKIMADVLNAAEAKGRRKYVRTSTRGESKTTINLPVGDGYCTGDIYDISIVGLSCVFNDDITLQNKTVIHDIQIRLQGSLLKVDGILYGSRIEERRNVYVILFSPKTDFSIKSKIRMFIQKRLQSAIDEEMQ